MDERPREPHVRGGDREPGRQECLARPGGRLPCRGGRGQHDRHLGSLDQQGLEDHLLAQQRTQRQVGLHARHRQRAQAPVPSSRRPGSGFSTSTRIPASSASPEMRGVHGTAHGGGGAREEHARSLGSGKRSRTSRGSTSIENHEDAQDPQDDPPLSLHRASLPGRGRRSRRGHRQSSECRTSGRRWQRARLQRRAACGRLRARRRAKGGSGGICVGRGICPRYASSARPRNGYACWPAARDAFRRSAGGGARPSHRPHAAAARGRQGARARALREARTHGSRRSA